jgi:cysteine-S-conjugate beta-lyase
MSYDFDTRIDRRGTNSAKWSYFDPDVLPMFVADMDFRSPEAVIRALHELADQGTFGYQLDCPELREVICDRMERLYQWQVKPEQIVFSPGLVTGLNTTMRAVGQPGDGVLMTTPVYGPFLSAPPQNARFANMTPLRSIKDGQRVHYEIDFDALEAAVTAQTTMFALCNPHNPIGRVYPRDELEQLAALCLKHNLVIVADEIHCDLLLDGNRHIPIAALAPEIAEKTITLMAPSKTFNLPGLFCGFMIVQNETLRQQIMTAGHIAGHVNAAGFKSALAAYSDGHEWLAALLPYLQANRDYVVSYVQEHFPTATTTCPEGTYLAWLDFREANLPSKPFDFFLKEARVALSSGDFFGREFSGFVRLNFGCPRSMLTEALERMRTAMEQL